MITTENFTRVNNDVNGNPRYVIHFMDLLTNKEREDIRENAKPMQYINDAYLKAIAKSKQLGGKKYSNKSYGGGIVFQSYNLDTLVKDINTRLLID